MSLLQKISNLSPQQLYLFYLFLLSEDKKNQPVSTLTNKEELESVISGKWPAQGQVVNMQVLVEKIVKIIKETTSQDPFVSDNVDAGLKQVEDEAYQNRVDKFCKYIRDRSKSREESQETCLCVLVSLCDFFLQCGNIETDFLLAKFPFQEEEFNCFEGLKERLNAFRVSKNPLIQMLQDVFIRVESTLYEDVKRGINIGNDVHIKTYFHGLNLGEYNQESINFGMHAFNLGKSLNNMVGLFYQEALKKAEFDDKLDVRLTGVFLKVLEESAGVEFISNDKILIQGALDKAFAVKVAFEKKFKEYLKAEFSVDGSSLAVLRGMDVFDYLDVKNGCHSFSMRREDIVKLVTVKEKEKFEIFVEMLEQFQGKTAVDFTQDIRRDGFDEDIYSSDFNLAAKLRSENIFEMFEALNIAFALAKNDYGSCIFVVFDADVVEAMNELKVRFDEHKGDLFYEANRCKLDCYFKFYEQFETISAREPYAQIFPKVRAFLESKNYDEIADLPSENLLFILANLTKEAAAEFVSKISDGRAFHMLTSIDLAFGSGISVYKHEHLLQSLLLRPDFDSIFQALFEKMERQVATEARQVEKNKIITENTILLLEFFVNAKECGIENNEYILRKIGEVDLSKINSFPEELVTRFIKAPNMSVDDKAVMLRFIGKFNLGNFGLCLDLLRDAILYGNKDVVEAIMQHVIANNSPEVLKRLLQSTRVDGRSVFVDGMNILEYAIKEDSVESVETIINILKVDHKQLLLDLFKKITGDKTVLMEALLNERVEVVKAIINSLKDSNKDVLLDILKQVNESNYNALVYAVLLGNDAVVEAMIDFLNDNCSDDDLFYILTRPVTQNVLVAAILEGKIETVRVIINSLKGNKDVCSQLLRDHDAYGNNAVLYAVISKRGDKDDIEAIVNSLDGDDNLETVKEIFTRVSYNKHALQHAVSYGYADVVAVIINFLKNYEDILRGLLMSEEDNLLRTAIAKGDAKVVEAIINSLSGNLLDDLFKCFNQDGDIVRYAISQGSNGVLEVIINSLKESREEFLRDILISVDDDGNNILSFAVLQGDVQDVSAIINYIKNSGDLELLKLISRYKVDIDVEHDDIQKKYIGGALALALILNKVEVAEFIIFSLRDVSLTNEEGIQYPLVKEMLTSGLDNDDLVELFTAVCTRENAQVASFMVDNDIVDLNLPLGDEDIAEYFSLLPLDKYPNPMQDEQRRLISFFVRAIEPDLRDELNIDFLCGDFEVANRIDRLFSIVNAIKDEENLLDAVLNRCSANEFISLIRLSRDNSQEVALEIINYLNRRVNDEIAGEFVVDDDLEARKEVLEEVLLYQSSEDGANIFFSAVSEDNEILFEALLNSIQILEKAQMASAFKVDGSEYGIYATPTGLLKGYNTAFKEGDIDDGSLPTKKAKMALESSKIGAFKGIEDDDFEEEDEQKEGLEQNNDSDSEEQEKMIDSSDIESDLDSDEEEELNIIQKILNLSTINGGNIISLILDSNNINFAKEFLTLSEVGLDIEIKEKYEDGDNIIEALYSKTTPNNEIESPSSSGVNEVNKDVEIVP